MQKILIVDDDKLICLQIHTLLEEWGYIPGFITTPEYLFPRLEHEDFDLILMDVNMPGKDGVTLLQQLKADPSYEDIPVVMLTAESDDQLLAKCFQAGAADFANKPIREVILQSRVKAALLRRQYVREIQKTRDELEKRVEERTIELKNLGEVFRRFVPTQFLQPILDQGSLKSGYFEAKPMSILFGDIRSYTTLAESMKAGETFAFLNEFFGVIDEAITKNKGFIDKFIGDAVMALFEGKNSAQNAVHAAIEMQQAIDEYNKERDAQQLNPVRFGIGVNTGEVMMGALGSSTRLNSTVLGDHVNLASRLETLTKKFQTRILISHYTFKDLPKEDYLTRRIDNLRVKGKKNPVQIYEVLGF